MLEPVGRATGSFECVSLRAIDRISIVNTNLELAQLQERRKLVLNGVPKREIRVKWYRRRLRAGDIQVGESNLLEELFTEPRFNVWAVGEVHIFDKRITPNGRRDHFEQNTHFANLWNHLAPIAREISRRCRQSSIERKWLREFATHERLVREKLDIIEQMTAPKSIRDELLAEAKMSLAKMERVSGLDGLVFLDRPELANRYKEIAHAVDKRAKEKPFDDPLAELPAEKQLFYRELVRLIYRHSRNRIAAKSLVDRIFMGEGLLPLPTEALSAITKS